jgi:hypothetical protein
VTNFRNFDLNLLLVLDGVLREGTLSNAAKALNVSQPTIKSSLLHCEGRQSTPSRKLQPRIRNAA